MSFLLFDVEFIEKVLSFIGFLSVLFSQYTLSRQAFWRNN